MEIGEDETMEDLYQKATECFGCECSDLRSGFPPMSLEKSAAIKVRLAIPRNDSAPFHASFANGGISQITANAVGEFSLTEHASITRIEGEVDLENPKLEGSLGLSGSVEHL